MFSTDDRQLKEYELRLMSIGLKGIPMAAATTLNNMAFQSKQLSTKQFEQDHIIRSSWTQRGMQYQKTKQNIPIRQMEARSGNIRDYAETLEHGGTKRPKSGSNIQIPGLRARISKNKRKRISRGFALDRLKGVRRMPSISGGPKRKMAAMLNMGRRKKDFGPFLITDKDQASGGYPSPGIYMLTGAGRSKRKGGVLEMVRKLRKSAVINGHPFVEPAGREIGGKMDKIYIRNANFILKKYGKAIR